MSLMTLEELDAPAEVRPEWGLSLQDLSADERYDFFVLLEVVAFERVQLAGGGYVRSALEVGEVRIDEETGEAEVERGDLLHRYLATMTLSEFHPCAEELADRAGQDLADSHPTIAAIAPAGLFAGKPGAQDNV